MNATMRFIVWGTIPFGAMCGGVLGNIIDLHPTIWVGALGGLIAFIPVTMSSVREIRAMPAVVDGASILRDLEDPTG